MLLLEPGEIFFEDYSVSAKSLLETEWTDGRLKLCSKSLVFVNKDLNRPLIKIQLKEVIGVEKWNSEEWDKGLIYFPFFHYFTIYNDKTSLSFLFFHRSDNVLCVKCKQYVEMLEGNVLAPYKFLHKENRYFFKFNYAKIEDCLPHILQLLRAATLPTAEQNAMVYGFIVFS